MNYRVEFIRHLRRRGLAPTTIERYEIHLVCLEEWLDRSAVTASTADLEAFLATRKIEDRSKYQWISSLSCFYVWTNKVHGLPVLNPTETIDRPRLRRLLPRPISESDLTFAMEQADGRMYVWLVLGAYAGFRCCEMAWLTVESIMWHEGLINVLGKGGKERIVEMHPLVTEALRSYRLPSYGRAFRQTADRVSPLSPRNVSNAIGEFFDDIGVNARAHQLRHRFGTKTWEACHDLLVVKELMGHANVQTTTIYTAFSRVHARAAVLALPVPNDTPNDETDEAA